MLTPNATTASTAAIHACGFPCRAVRMASGTAASAAGKKITETMAMASPEIVTSVLERLRELGIRFSIDDFGTGYSSMAYLRRFRIDRLKIDRSFVENLGRDPDDEAIARAIIQLAKALRIETIAEGVETEAQLDFLRFTGCDYIQGFYLSPPVPADAITQLLQPVLDTT